MNKIKSIEQVRAKRVTEAALLRGLNGESGISYRVKSRWTGKYLTKLKYDIEMRFMVKCDLGSQEEALILDEAGAAHAIYILDTAGSNVKAGTNFVKEKI